MTWSGTLGGGVRSGPRITIALPAYARPKQTQVALRSALNQTYPAHEIIVSDDCQDDTIRLIVEAERCDRVVYVANRPAMGIPDKINDLLNRATGDWIVYLGDDDFFEPKLLEYVADAIRSDPELVLVRSRARMIDDEGRVIGEDRVRDCVLSSSEFLMEMYQYWYRMRISITGFFFPVALMRRLGGFKKPCPDGFYYYDTVAWTTLALQGRSRLIGETLFTLSEIRVQMHSQQGIDGRALIESRAAVAQTIDKLVNDAIDARSNPQHKADLNNAKEHALRFVAEETRIAIRRSVAVATLAARGADGAMSVRRLVDAARSTPQAHVLDLGLKVHLALFDRIALWPWHLRLFIVKLVGATVSIIGRWQRGGRSGGPVGLILTSLAVPLAICSEAAA
jgi:glycosyltransferase involved in cell wall biosynthesis